MISKISKNTSPLDERLATLIVISRLVELCQSLGFVVVMFVKNIYVYVLIFSIKTNLQKLSEMGRYMDVSLQPLGQVSKSLSLVLYHFIF